MTTRSVVTAFIIFVIGIMLGRCSAPEPHPPSIDGAVDVTRLTDQARQCIYSNLPSVHADRAFAFVAADCQVSGGLSHP